MTNLWHDIERKTSQEFNVIIEIPRDSQVKYEIDKETGTICFDRVMHSPVHYPGNYGFIPQTLWEDGDAMDVIVICRHALVPGCLVRCRPVGVLEMIDDGESDAKVLAVAVSDHQTSHIKDISDMEEFTLQEISHFFEVYKQLKKKEVKVGKWCNAKQARKDIQKSFELYDEKFGK